jgi:murein DD-endopeptidase MepM/ murein hydrolase activator NlpD
MTVKMFEKNYYNKNRITSYFGENRERMEIPGYTWHEGIDYSGHAGTKLVIKDLFSGKIVREGFNNIYGNYVEVMHNPKFIGGESEIFYMRYCHLESIEKNLPTGLLKYGTKIGIMGNTGHSYGVHLHLDCRQKSVKKGFKTRLLLDIQDNIHFENDEHNFNWQFGNLYINPMLMMKYFAKLQGAV